MVEATRVLERRLSPRALGPIDIVSELRHFALITYAVPPERLRRHIPERFELFQLEIDGRKRALLSIVPFLDEDFHFARAPWARRRFAQTNHRVYVIDRVTGEHAVWFFGTTLGSWLVYPARWLWRIPWHRARYQVDCRFDEAHGRYERFRYEIRSPWCSGRVALEDTGRPMELCEGFASMDDQVLVLTHPVDGYFFRTDGGLGTYSVSHAVIELTTGHASDLYFSLYDRLGILGAEEMQRPCSVLISRRTVFSIHMPPRRTT